jgi:hypothetical protein
METFVIVLLVLVVAGLGATVKELLFDGYGSTPLDPERVRHAPIDETDVAVADAPLYPQHHGVFGGLRTHAR